MLQTTNEATDNELQSTRNKNQGVPGTEGAGGTGGASGAGESNKNLSITKKLKKKWKANSIGADFLTSDAKEIFIHLRKAFTKAPILRHFDSECHIRIEIDASGYAIGGVLSQMTLD